MLQSVLNHVERFHVRIKRFLHLLVNWHHVVDWISFLFFVLVNYLKLYLVKFLSMIYDQFVGFIQLTEFWCCVLNYNLFIRMNQFGLSSVGCTNIVVRAIFFNAQNFVAVEKSHILQKICCFWFNFTLDVYDWIINLADISGKVFRLYYFFI